MGMNELGYLWMELFTSHKKQNKTKKKGEQQSKRTSMDVSFFGEW